MGRDGAARGEGVDRGRAGVGVLEVQRARRAGLGLARGLVHRVVGMAAHSLV